MNADDVKSAVKEAIEEKMGSFFIEREQHFLDHQYISGIRSFQDRLKAQACKTVTHIGIGSVALLLLWGLYYFVSKVSAGQKP